ncbi:MAG TPA: dynamin family protein [Hydrogenophilus thermoluteolus]|nr:dynamin family protein [Hydrogenophilus thermoluteolus]
MESLARSQEILQRQLPQVRAIYERHGLDRERIDQLTPLIERFEIRIPLIGAFSSGKSSLLNALLGEKILATDVTPETAVPAELRFGPERHFLGCFPDGRRIPLDETDLRENRLAELLPQGWVEAQLPNPTLAKRPQLVLVDLPGWDSGITAHERVIDDYVGRSLAYGVVVSVEDGALRDTLRRALRELAIAQMPVIVIVAKADKRPPEDVQTVAKQLHDQIAALMDREPLALAVTSARKKTLDTLEAALDLLQSKAAEIFATQIVASYRTELNHAAQLLETLANQKNQDAEKIQAEIDKLKQDLQTFDARLQHETEALEAQIEPILATIRRRAERALADRLETFTERALDGRDISDEILTTIRLVVAEAVRQEFQPALQRYLERLTDSLPSSLDIHLHRVTSASDNATSTFRWNNLAVVLGPWLARIPHPIGKAVSLLLPLLASLFTNLAEQKRQEIEAARQRERTRSQVRQVIDDALRQVDAHLRTVLTEQVRAAQAEVARTIASERDELQKTLATLLAALQQGEAETAALRERAQADLDRLNALLAELPATH